MGRTITTEELLIHDKKIVSTEELFGNRKKIVSTEELFDTRPKIPEFRALTPELKAQYPHTYQIPHKEVERKSIENLTDTMITRATGLGLEELKARERKLNLVTSRLPLLATGFASPITALGVEAYHQAKNVIVSSLKQESYSPLEIRMVSEFVPPDAPNWLKMGAMGAEMAGDVALLGAFTNLAKQGLLKQSIKEVGIKLEKAGYGSNQVEIPKEAIREAVKGTTLEREAQRLLAARAFKVTPKPPTTTKLHPSEFTVQRADEALKAKLGLIKPIQPIIAPKAPLPVTTPTQTPIVQPSEELKGEVKPETKVAEPELYTFGKNDFKTGKLATLYRILPNGKVEKFNNSFKMWSDEKITPEELKSFATPVIPTGKGKQGIVEGEGKTSQLDKPTYGMAHRPTFEGMPPSHNLLEGDVIPRDVYEHPEFSIASGRNLKTDKAAKESWEVLQKIKGKPNEEVTIYRATRKNELNTGDWVTFSKTYAEDSVELNTPEKVYSFKVKAKDVIFAGDDINEFGYYPKLEPTPQVGEGKVEMIDVSATPKRARAVGMNKEKWDFMAKDIKANGVKVPIIIDKESGMVLDGHARLTIAEDLGIKKVPVVYVDKSNMDKVDITALNEQLTKQYNPKLFQPTGEGNLLESAKQTIVEGKPKYEAKIKLGTKTSDKIIDKIKKSLIKEGRTPEIVFAEEGFLGIRGEVNLEMITALPQAIKGKLDAVQNIVKHPMSKEIVNDLQNINLRAERDRADALVRVDYLRGLTDQEDLWLTDLVEGMVVNIPNKEQFNKLWVISRKLKKSLGETWTKASIAGVKEKIVDETGTRWIPIRKVENYVPREIKPEIREKIQGGLKQLYARIAELKNKGVRSNIKQALMEAQQTGDPYIVRLIDWVNSLEIKTTPSSVIRFIDKLINRDYIPSYGHLERPRTAEMLPPEFYERRASVLFNRYFAGAARRIAEVERFGSTNEKLLRRLSVLEKENHHEGVILRELIKRYKDITGHELSSHLATGISIMKIGLGTATIPNITQSLISTIPKQGVMNFVRGALEMATKPETQMMVNKTGLPYQNVLNELLGFRDVGALSKVNDFLTRYNGFQGINRLNVLLSAASTKSYLEHSLLPKVNSKIPIIRNWALSNLKKLNILPQDIIEGKISEAKKIDAMLLASRDYQLFSDITNEPLWLSDPKLRWLMVLKRFGYKQALFTIHKVIYDELKYANPFPLLRLIAGGIMGGAFIIWANRKLWELGSFVKAKIRGEAPGAPDWYTKWDDSDRKIYETTLDLMAQAGTVGALSDITRLDSKGRWSLGRQLEFQLTPVMLSEFVRGGQLIDILVKGRKEKGRRIVEIPVEERLYKVGERLMSSFPITKYVMEK